MTLTPMDIHNKEFSTKMRGYNQDEVNEFLNQVIKEFEILLRNKRELEDELNIAQEKLANYDEMQHALNKSIIVAQDAADRLRENTDKEMDVVKREASSYAMDVKKEADKYATQVREDVEAHADSLLQEAVVKARKIEEETEQLRKHNRVFRQRLQLLIESQLELIKKDEWDEVLQGTVIENPEIETIEEVEKELGFNEAEQQDAAEAAEESDVEADDATEEQPQIAEGMTPAVEPEEIPEETDEEVEESAEDN